MSELLSRTTRGLFRDLMAGSTVGRIAAAFQDEGFAPNPDCTYGDSSVRRETTQEYLEAVDWTDHGHVGRALRAIERLVADFEPSYGTRCKFLDALGRDGYPIDETTGHIAPAGPTYVLAALAAVRDPSALRQQLARFRSAVIDDPGLAIGTAKELVESTAKVVLTERGLPVDDNADLPVLVRDAQQALGLHPSAASPGPDGSDAVRRILGAVSTIANNLAELRNKVGSGHGRATAPAGLRTRHAHLAVNAAITWCQLLLDTLADPDAPWRTGQP